MKAWPIYPPEQKLNKDNTKDTEAPFFVANGFIYDKRDDFDFDIVNFSFLDGDVPRRASCGVHVYISQRIRFKCYLLQRAKYMYMYMYTSQTSPAGLSVSQTSKNIFLILP